MLRVSSGYVRANLCRGVYRLKKDTWLTKCINWKEKIKNMISGNLPECHNKPHHSGHQCGDFMWAQKLGASGKLKAFASHFFF